MNTPCPHCTGSFYLADTPDLGPCVCCTPEGMQHLKDCWNEATSELADLEYALNSHKTGWQEAERLLRDYFVARDMPRYPLYFPQEALEGLHMVITDAVAS